MSFFKRRATEPPTIEPPVYEPPVLEPSTIPFPLSGLQRPTPSPMAAISPSGMPMATAAPSPSRVPPGLEWLDLGEPIPMPPAKDPRAVVSVSLHRDLLAQIQDAATRAGVSVSSFIQDAAIARAIPSSPPPSPSPDQLTINAIQIMINQEQILHNKACTSRILALEKQVAALTPPQDPSSGA